MQSKVPLLGKEKHPPATRRIPFQPYRYQGRHPNNGSSIAGPASILHLRWARYRPSADAHLRIFKSRRETRFIVSSPPEALRSLPGDSLRLIYDGSPWAKRGLLMVKFTERMVEINYTI
ncbi:hypothetical protein GWI33_000154 [Rhynchophorus ferrugineus]|uniref:Uncharacterized protein n=1 Tax=Rhynchophorus ferrugineus TaxID=354439 RepID=A0A834MM15_RHYFE|nr:hypothetical protein GWI33_000154 [Rhynchophorus ferrugineus]